MVYPLTEQRKTRSVVYSAPLRVIGLKQDAVTLNNGDMGASPM